MDWYSSLPVAVMVCLVAVDVAIRWRRNHRNCDPLLRPIVEGRGLTYISSRPATWKECGVFPRFEVTWGRPTSNIMFTSGEYTLYRMVMISDSVRGTREVCARLKFEMFSLAEVQWHPDPVTG